MQCRPVRGMGFPHNTRRASRRFGDLFVSDALAWEKLRERAQRTGPWRPIKSRLPISAARRGLHKFFVALLKSQPEVTCCRQFVCQVTSIWYTDPGRAIQWPWPSGGFARQVTFEFWLLSGKLSSCWAKGFVALPSPCPRIDREMGV